MRRALATSLLIAAGAIATTQGQPGADTLNVRTSIGSFKMIDGQGLTSFSFEGTVLLVDVQGDVKVEGNLKKEFDDPKLKRRAYFGKGKLTINGKWRAIQWFGSNMQGTFKGKGLVRLTGEFDRNLDTGSYWYGNRTEDKRPWHTAGITIPVPEDPRTNPRPQRRGGFGGG